MSAPGNQWGDRVFSSPFFIYLPLTKQALENRPLNF